MKKFRLLWTEHTVYELLIKAKNKDDAEEKFYSGDYNKKAKIREIGGDMVENSLEVEECEE